MKSSIQVGDTATITFTVISNMQPQFSGETIHSCCSTWDMAHQFEIAARKTLEPHLHDDEQGIGTYLSVDHCSPAPVGKTVVVEAKITELDDTTVNCKLTASIGDAICATGKQIQKVLPCSVIHTLIEKATLH
jgi:predicted thioesterase